MSDFDLIIGSDRINAIAPEHLQLTLAEPFIFMHHDQVVGKGEIEFSECGSFVEVAMIEVLEKRKGYGRIFVEYLKSLPNVKEISGESVADAVPFWLKIGATFNQQAFDQYLNDGLDEGDLVPFSIAC